ncbi:MAG: helix-turn-helix transcriptional regulator [Deltaproteobacteria bacterium]|nr:helix-turn-helix transcriptional regulator [Deltaproteobacteria bacterium]
MLDLIMFERLITRSELARLSEVSPPTITRMFCNKRCTVVTARKILKGLKMRMNEVLEFKPDSGKSKRRQRARR